MKQGKPSKPPKVVSPNSFEADAHFYQKTLNAQVSSVVNNFMNLGNDRIVSRYMHLNPNVDRQVLESMLRYKPKYFKWSGTDLFNVTNNMGVRKMVLIETNSCPSGQKSFPLLEDRNEHGGYRTLLEKTFKHMLEEAKKDGTLPEGRLAVIFDKNGMEASGYAATLADIFNEKVLYAEFFEDEPSPNVRFDKDTNIMQILDNGEWINIRAAFRYVTQKPWNRIPVISTRTVILNPVICCLSGGRNKLLAAKAYDFLNSEIINSGLKLNIPKTIRDVEKKVIPIWVSTMGGFAVIKNPYSNAGQGVWTITNQKELDDFMNIPEEYDCFIVQSLIGNSNWSSTSQGQMYHVGTVPDKHNNIYVADLRMMVHYNYEVGGFSPLALYARRAQSPLQDELKGNSWEVLGTNLSVKVAQGTWDTDIKRLIIADRKDFNKLGLGVDNLIDAYIESVLATVAIDKMACRLTKEDGSFDLDLFASLNKDQALINEINEFTPQ